MRWFLEYHNPFRRVNAGERESDALNRALLNSKLDRVRAELAGNAQAVPFREAFHLNHPLLSALGLTALTAAYLRLMRLSPFPALPVFLFSAAYLLDQTATNRYSFWLENFHLLDRSAQLALQTGDHRHIALSPEQLQPCDPRKAIC